MVDTNVLLYIAKGLIPLSSLMDVLGASYKVVVPDKVVEELKILMSSNKGFKSRLAKRALEVVQEIAIIEPTSVHKADDAVIELALRFKNVSKVVVATADKELRSRLREVGIPTLYYRESRGGLELEWEPLA
ncbi:MAG: PIN domain-containing protein [Acidilobaceae archaeon]